MAQDLEKKGEQAFTGSGRPKASSDAVDLAQARSTIFDYIEIFYNRQRLHSSLGYRSLAEYDKMAMVPN